MMTTTPLQYFAGKREVVQLINALTLIILLILLPRLLLTAEAIKSTWVRKIKRIKTTFQDMVLLSKQSHVRHQSQKAMMSTPTILLK